MSKKRNLAVEELIIDLKAAISIGDIESIAYGLEHSLEIPVIASNERLSESAIGNIVLPIGKVLAHPVVKDEFLLALAQDRLTGIRSISAVAQTYRFLNGDVNAKKEINKLVRDHREEVGFSITQTMQAEPLNLEKIEELINDWMQVQKEREWVAALNLAHLLETQNVLLDLYDQAYQADLPNANKALVLSIKRKKLTNPALVEEIISRWSSIKSVNRWVMDQLSKE